MFIQDMDNFNLIPMRIRNYLEFSKEENKEYDLFQKIFPHYMEMSLGNGNKEIQVLYPGDKVKEFMDRIKFLDKKIYTYKMSYEVFDAVEFVFVRTHILKRPNRVGSKLIQKWDEFYRLRIFPLTHR